MRACICFWMTFCICMCLRVFSCFYMRYCCLYLHLYDESLFIAFIWVFVFAFMMRVCICIFTRVCICIYLKVCIWIHIMRVCICIYVYIRVFICIYMRVFICIYIKARTIPAITYYFPQIALLPGQTAQHLHKVSLSIFQYRYLSFYFCIVSTIHKHRPPRL